MRKAVRTFVDEIVEGQSIVVYGSTQVRSRMTLEEMTAIADAIQRSRSIRFVTLLGLITDEEVAPLVQAVRENTSLEHVHIESGLFTERATFMFAEAVDRRTTKLSVTVNPYNASLRCGRRIAAVAQRQKDNKTMLVFLTAIVRKKYGNAARSFLIRDGDTAMQHRIMEFLVES